jgi:hypothetical protein
MARSRGLGDVYKRQQLDILGIKLQHKKPALFELKTWTI